MCGIVGIFTRSNSLIDEDNFIEMRDVMSHRGPDNKGIYKSKGIMLGHRRLSIIDLSVKGSQPMKYKNYILVFNGEIYNFLEIKKDLVALGHKFTSTSDTEVLLHAYEEWQVDCLKHLNGMFSFAIYDEKLKKLFLVRDRLGVKPLYYYQTDSEVVFASEIKAIYKYKNYEPQLNKECLFDFFRYSFLPGKETLFKDIFKLLPGYYIICNFNNNKIRLKSAQYWDLPHKSNKDSFEEAKAKIEYLLSDSIRLRLIADVKVGVQLSGGIDSSLVTYYASKLSPKINTVTVDVQDENFSEKKYASYISKKLRLKSHYINLKQSQILSDLDRMIYIYDEPIYHANSVGLYLLSKYSKKEFSVLLTGEGADELFCGYDRYLQLIQYLRISKFPTKILRKIMAEKSLPHCYYNYLVEVQEKPYGDYYTMNVYNAISSKEVKKCLSSTLKIQGTNNYLLETLSKAHGYGILKNASYYDLKNYLGVLLQRQDRMSMAHAIEVREPFLDYRLVEYVFSLQDNYKVNKNQTKYILKKICERYFPKNFIYRKKMGFAIPLKSWLNSSMGHKLVEELEEALPNLSDILNVDFVKSLITKYKNNKNININLLWQLIVFNRWMRLYFPSKM